MRYGNVARLAVMATLCSSIGLPAAAFGETRIADSQLSGTTTSQPQQDGFNGQYPQANAYSSQFLTTKAARNAPPRYARKSRLQQRAKLKKPTPKEFRSRPYNKTQAVCQLRTGAQLK